MTISSDKLEHLGHYTKSLINDGVYYLFQSKDRSLVGVKYYLKTSKGEFLSLSGDGRILTSKKTIPEQSLGNYVYFNDIDTTTKTNSSSHAVSF